MSIRDAGGTLHGTWNSDVTVSTSDRRLKKNIRPIDQTLYKTFGKAASIKPPPSTIAGRRAASIKPGTGAPGAKPSVASWLLRQLRPVSYNFRQGNEAKYMRFGFIADEIEQVLPQVVRELPNQQQDPNAQNETQGEKPEPKKGIVYTDLIAVLTSIVKDFNGQLQGLQARMRSAEGELERLDQEDPMDSTGEQEDAHV